jgi:hypothetical protein
LRKDYVDYETGFCLPVALTVLEKKIFSLPVQKILGISEHHEQILKRKTQGIFLQKISFLDVIVSETKMFKKS